jgi:hypothetical protein
MSQIAFKKTATQYTPLNNGHGIDGKGIIIAMAHGTLTAKTPYKVILNEFGYVTAAMTTAVGRCYIGIPDKAYTTGQDATMQIAGYVTDVVTPSLTSAVGYGVKVEGGVIVSSGADWRGLNTEIGAFTEVSTGTTHDIMLYGKEIFEGAMSFGSTTNPVTDDTADRIFQGYYFDNGAATGTARGMYVRLYLTGGAGGEAIRAMTTVSNAAPADTVNGAHISINFGASAGNVTGQSAAVRATYHIANRTMTGTNACVNADLWADGASSAGSNISFFRCVLGGDTTGVAAMLTTCYWFNFDASVCSDTNGMVDTNLTASTQTAAIRILVNGTPRYIPVITGS